MGAPHHTAVLAQHAGAHGGLGEDVRPVSLLPGIRRLLGPPEQEPPGHLWDHPGQEVSPLWLQLPPRHEEVVMLMLLGLGTQPVAWGVCWPLPPACHLVDFVLCNVHATRDVDVHQVQGPPGCLKPNPSWAQPRPGRGGGRLTCARVTQPRTLV